MSEFKGTKGPVTVSKNSSTTVHVMSVRRLVDPSFRFGTGDEPEAVASFRGDSEVRKANAGLAAEAFNTLHTTGRTPRELADDNLELRRLLATAYGGATLYRDDGELQDNRERPFIDVVRMTVEEIKSAMWARANNQLSAARSES